MAKPAFKAYMLAVGFSFLSTHFGVTQRMKGKVTFPLYQTTFRKSKMLL
jgi:hypothetical protein